MSPPELNLLLRVLEERKLPFTADDVAWAFESSTTKDSATCWVQEFLQPTTLLTQDELDSYENSRPEPATGTSTISTPAGRPLSDDEIEAAIASLEASTAAIERQTKVLEIQKLALNDLQSRHESHSLTSAKDARQKKLARERAQIDFDIDELSQAASGRLRTAVKQSDAATGAIPSQLDRFLSKDDRLLDGLRKLLPRISDSSLDHDETAHVEQLCEMLNILAVKEIHARLDRVYHEAVADYHSRSRSRSVEVELSEEKLRQRDTARAELQELGSEIEGLVGIVVDHQHRKPLQKGLLASRAESQSQKAQWSEYAVTALLYLTSRLDAISDHIQHLRAHSRTLNTISQVMEETITTKGIRKGSSVREAGGTAVSTRTADKSSGSGAKGLKLLRLVQANRSEINGGDLAVQFLRQYDIRATPEDSPSKLSENLSTAIHSRKSNLSHLSLSTQNLLTDTLTTSLAQADADLAVLLESIYAHAEYASVRLVDQTLSSGLERLEDGTQKVGDEMRVLDVEGVEREVRRKQGKVWSKLGGG